MSLPSSYDPTAAMLALQIAYSVQDVASALNLEAGKLFYTIQNSDTGKFYKQFDINKKGGGTRTISAPVRGMALAQERLAAALHTSYQPKSHVHGYVRSKSFLTNASYHANQRLILNIDLNDFFGTITFPRVRGLFLSRYFGMNSRVSTILARLCTHEGCLPQGSKTSPILANIIANGLDRRLLTIAGRNRMRYTRYADDITFSSSQRTFPRDLIKSWDPEFGAREIELGSHLIDAVTQAGFSINQDKTRVHLRDERHIVTGLIVNEGANVWRRDVNKLRMKLHSASKFGADNAAKLWLGPNADAAKFWSHVVGWLAYIRQIKGADSPVLTKLCNRAADISPDLPKWVKDQAKMVHEFDLFLSHASEDKERVRKLYESLTAKGVKVFFDEQTITLGDSIVERINYGLLKSNLFVPFLSEKFSEKGWTNKELNSAIMASAGEGGRIIPIRDENFHVGNNYPILSDILNATWPEIYDDDFVDGLADQLLAVVEKSRQKTIK